MDRKRQQAWQDREDMIKKKMSLMADNVLKREDEQERELERRLLKLEEEKDQQAKREESIRRFKQDKINEKLKEALKQQTIEKQLLKRQEIQANDNYMQQWTKMLENQAKQQKQHENLKIQQKLQNQDFLKKQIHEKQVSYSKEAHSKSLVRGTMNEQELRYNKQLLQEVSSKKRQVQDTLQKLISPQRTSLIH